jgi:hypothetical protein
MAPKADGLAHMGSSYMIKVYERLLADISELSGVQLCTPNEITNEWVLKEAPKLDKELLLYIEGTGELPVFPEWLSPLVELFVSSMDAKYLRFIRQLLLFCYKVEYEPTDEQLKAAQAVFEDTDEAIAIWDDHFDRTHKAFYSAARQIVGRVIYRINWSDIIPSHGPGAVYPSAQPCDKSDFSTIYSTIDPYYPYYDYFCGIPSFAQDLWKENNRSLRQSESIEARLVAVPTDSRGPRLICVHPRESIWIQQGCRKLLERAIMSSKSPCHGRITFNDQGTNGKLALESSKNREFCTLDLKEASDRISCKLVRFLFGDYAYGYLSCSRASEVKLLDGRVIKLRKWAPMGNALCFPVQSLIFYALVRAGIRSHYGIDCREVFVFGDDILFPTKYYDGAVQALARSGLIPNPNKTFRHGFFRESCGVDAFKGVNVTPHRLRRLDVESVSGAMSVSSLAKRLRIDGFRMTSDGLYRMLSDHGWKLHLSNNPDAQGIFRYEPCQLDTLMRYGYVRFNSRIHRWESKLLLVTGTIRRIRNDAWWHLQDSLLKLEALPPSEGTDRGLEYTVPHRARLKRGWTEVR